MLKVQLLSEEGVAVTVTVARPILARLIREVEAAFDDRLQQARNCGTAGASTRDAVLADLLLNRARLRLLLGEDASVRVRIERENEAFEVDVSGEVLPEHRSLANEITHVDLAEYQVRHGHGYQQVLPSSLSLKQLGYWRKDCGQELYVAAEETQPGGAPEASTAR